MTEETEEALQNYIDEIEDLLEQPVVPPVLRKSGCKKCAYYEYCYI